MKHLPSPKASETPHFLYAALLSDAVVKVGVTWNPRNRSQQLALKLKPRTLVAMDAFQLGRGARRHVAERELIERMSRIGRQIVPHREFFAGVSFEDATALALAIAAKSTAPAAEAQA